MDTRERFNTLQSQIRVLVDEQRTLSIGLAVKYGSGNEHYAKRSELRRLETLNERIATLSNKLYDLLGIISPRDWRSGVPCSYITTHLSYEDAVTRDALSAVPPCAWGATVQELQRFAQPLVSKFDDVRRG